MGGQSFDDIIYSNKYNALIETKTTNMSVLGQMENQIIKLSINLFGDGISKSI